MVSGIITATLLGLLLIGAVWAYSPRRKREFDAAAALPLDEDSHDDERTNSAQETDR